MEELIDELQVQIINRGDTGVMLFIDKGLPKEKVVIKNITLAIFSSLRQGRWHMVTTNLVGTIDQVMFISSPLKSVGGWLKSKSMEITTNDLVSEGEPLSSEFYKLFISDLMQFVTHLVRNQDICDTFLLLDFPTDREQKLCHQPLKSKFGDYI
ncbi:hypothetical protein KUTeg_006949 [Tegillarca granosa]|uniref:Uncharacterized protein n=1 Tax=Tegillarca granosa TaxID=220873 RepID=A0ABQ9FBT6_TEGGR|nr:hypothetical protein KUTeg_006949 [Tegillarca granosa]